MDYIRIHGNRAALVVDGVVEIKDVFGNCFGQTGFGDEEDCV